MKKWFILGAVAVLLIGFMGLKACMYKYIQPNEVGVWMTNGGQNGISDYQTWTGHFPIDFNPLTKSFTLPAQPWTVDWICICSFNYSHIYWNSYGKITI